MAVTAFSWTSYIYRVIFAIILVFATYNPSGISYVHWAFGELATFSAAKALVGLIILIGWLVFLHATIRSLGIVGVTLTVAFFGVLFWLIISMLRDWLPTNLTTLLLYVLLLIVSFVLATGISWSHIRKRLTGQVDVDEVDT